MQDFTCKWTNRKAIETEKKKKQYIPNNININHINIKITTCNVNHIGTIKFINDYALINKSN